jgi:hypothetical protein
LTLSELQEIGREIGVAPDAVARAAAQLDQATPVASPMQLPAAAVTRRRLGFPVGVGRTVALPRKMTESEWEQLVVDLRSTFDAKGRIELQGSFREWRNGNLRAIVEPAPSGERFTLKSVKKNDIGLLTLGSILAVGGALMAFSFWARAEVMPEPMNRALIFAVVGSAMFTGAALRLRAWARERRAQFDNVIGRLLSVMQRDK